MITSIDINCDMGESYGNFHIGNDAAIMPLISSSNIACGFHGGDPLHIERTIQLAKENDVRIGAHPSFPDRQGFGRRMMQLSNAELIALVKYQVAAVYGLCQAADVQLQYVKPHGALYNLAVQDQDVFYAIVDAVKAVDADLLIMTSAQNPELKSIGNNGISEAFIDRNYEDNGNLRSRKLNDAVIKDPAQAWSHLKRMIFDKQVKTYSGKIIPMHASSFCIHGDNQNAVLILEYIHQQLKLNGISIAHV